MKINTLGVALVAVLALPFAVGCSEDTSNAAAKTAESAKNDLKEMGNKVADAAKKVPAQLEELKMASEKKLAGVDDTIADLKKRAEAKSGEAKVEFENLISDIKMKKDQISKSFSEMDVKAASADAYDAAKKKVDAMMIELNKMVDRAKGM